MYINNYLNNCLNKYIHEYYQPTTPCLSVKESHYIILQSKVIICYYIHNIYKYKLHQISYQRKSLLFFEYHIVFNRQSFTASTQKSSVYYAAQCPTKKGQVRAPFTTQPMPDEKKYESQAFEYFRFYSGNCFFCGEFRPIYAVNTSPPCVENVLVSMRSAINFINELLRCAKCKMVLK